MTCLIPPLGTSCMTLNRPRILIVGASARAAAWSAVRAGLEPVCADRFSDLDVRQIAEIVSVADYPATIPFDVSRVVVDAWMFVGAMENHRRVLKRMFSAPRLGRYCGPSLEALERLRDPAWLADRLRSLRAYPETLVSVAAFDERRSCRDVRWLRKPIFGSGGRAICRETDALSDMDDREPIFWQREIDGVPLAATFLATSSDLRLLMVSRQIIGWSEAAAPTPYTYCGSIAPWPVPAELRERLLSICARLTDGIDVLGLIGIDFVWDGANPWVVDVNPRYTASTELWEFLTGRAAISEHLHAFGLIPDLPRIPPQPKVAASYVGKTILFADRPVIAPDLSQHLVRRSEWTMPDVADIPACGVRIDAAEPMCTVFASGETPDSCMEALLCRQRDVRARFREV